MTYLAGVPNCTLQIDILNLTSCHLNGHVMVLLNNISINYSHLSNKRGGWNKRGRCAKFAKSLNVEVGINMEVGILWKKLMHNSNKPQWS